MLSDTWHAAATHLAASPGGDTRHTVTAASTGGTSSASSHTSYETDSHTAMVSGQRVMPGSAQWPSVNVYKRWSIGMVTGVTSPDEAVDWRPRSLLQFCNNYA